MATTADILGLSSRLAIPRRWASYHERLCDERDRLSARDCSAPESSPTKIDELADAGSEQTLQDMSLVSAAATSETLYEIAEALQRIERGTYGICEITGEPIEVERLSAIPWARYSYAGQDHLEKDGLGRKPGLPALGVIREAEPVEQAEE